MPLLIQYDWVLQEHQTTYTSSDDDDVVMSAAISRHHDDLSNGTVGALDSNADGDPLLYTSGNIAGRIQIQASWYDAFGRVTDTVSYGTYGGSNFDRDGLSVPSRSDTALVTSYVYNTDGTRLSVTDPRGLETRFEYDAAGRTVTTIRNYVNGTPSSETGDDDVHIRTVYQDGLRTKYWLDLDGQGDEDAGTDQVTTYTYGTTKGTSAGESKIGTGHLLQKVAYPDSGGASDTVTFAYNAQSQEIWKKDQAANVIESVYDTSGRQTHRRVTTLDGDFDGAVLRISTTYDSLGRRQLVTQYDNATVGSGSVVDEVKFTYNDWGELETYEQDNDSAVGGSGVAAYQVSYAFAKATNGRNTIRRKSMTLPSGAGYTFSYSSSSNRLDADASRITFLQDGVLPSPSTSIVEYEYVGVGQVVGRDHLTVDVKQEYFGGSGYDSLDRFNRVTNDIWVKDLGTDVAIYDVDLTYDRNSNITLLDDNVHSVAFDAAFTMDDLDRLTKATEGDLDGNSTIQTKEREEEWTLTQSDNWFRNKLDLDGNGTYTGTDELDEERTHNTVNELTARDIDNDDTDDYTLTYDEAGNLIDDGETYKYEYDAFYRLRKVKERTSPYDLVGEYRYNGLGHRIAEHVDTEPDGDVDASDPWHHFAYNERWQMVAMFEGSDTDPTEEYLNHGAGNGGYGGASYIDDVVFRDRDTDANGSLDERIWYSQNWHHDVVAIVDDSGHQLEMVRYRSYGPYFGMPGGDADSDGDNDSADHSQILTWGTSGPYDVRGDMDLDGDIDNSDKSIAEGAPFTGAALARAVLSMSDVDSSMAYAGYRSDPNVASIYGIRRRVYFAQLGRWSERDLSEYVDGMNLLTYVGNNPVRNVDSTGLYKSGPYEASRCDGCQFKDIDRDMPTRGGGGFHIDISPVRELDGFCDYVEEWPQSGWGPPLLSCEEVFPCAAIVGWFVYIGNAPTADEATIEIDSSSAGSASRGEVSMGFTVFDGDCNGFPVLHIIRVTGSDFSWSQRSFFVTCHSCDHDSLPWE